MRQLKFRTYLQGIGFKYFNINENVTVSIKNGVNQFTGLTDKLGVEIYVGDILRLYVLDYDFEPTETYGKVLRLPDGCWYVGGVNDSIYDCIQYQDKHFEVIGNIYENLDLLDNN